jgi:hypothetical protein
VSAWDDPIGRIRDLEAEVAALRGRVAQVITGLDDDRARGRIRTYGDVQRELRAALEVTA